MFFSIIVPTYNRAHLITRTLTSILNQSHTDFEIIVVDDCSTDETESVISQYLSMENFRYLRNEKNYERGYSRNRGMKSAKGDFVTFLDSDDILFPDFLKDAFRFTEKNRTYRIFHSCYNLTNDKGELVYRVKFPSLKNQRRAIANGNFLSCHAVFIHREIYTHYTFDENRNFSGSEDWDFWLRILAEYPLGRISKTNSAMIVHPGRDVLSLTPEKLDYHRKHLLDRMVRHPVLSKTYEPFLRRISSSYYVYTAILSNQKKDYSVALQYLWRAVREDYMLLFMRRFLRALQIAVFRIAQGH